MQQTEWWKNGVIYQIYPKSFQDTSGNGRGDIRGIIQRLDYLQMLGVDGIWITPIYPSPQIDNGYDVADYCAINPDYGTMADFELLVAEAHRRNIRIVMDMVFNHTSTEHAWFKQAQDPESKYHDYYIWRGEDKTQSPNNWRSKFGGGAWQWSEQVGKHYLHLFATEQADLNWENEKVRQQLQQVCHFWADKGVDGLRLDVVNLVSKNQDFPNDDQGDGRRFYTDGPRIHEFMRELSEQVFQPRGLMTVGEMSSTSLQNCQQYAALNGSELSMTFNFHHLKVDYPNGEKWTYAAPDYVELKSIFNYWQQGMHGKAWNALFWCNHDQPRIVSRFGDETALHTISGKMLAMVLHGMQGTPYIYQGEEFGMTNPGFTRIEQYRDVESLNMYQELLDKGLDQALVLKILAQKSRDNSRTPMQWNTLANAGFSTAEPWIGVAPNYRQVNAESAVNDPDSVFYCYKKLIALRKSLPILTDGDYQDLLPQHPSVWSYLRTDSKQKLWVLANLSNQTQSLERPQQTAGEWQTLLHNYPQALALGDSIELAPYQAVYLLQSV
ncbi:alpha,alpha-phosphotrehalase [Testudinibacter sp. TR-2022]|uniref:alpha,alpha-phosphotrehalase n=1 Tax=Testudinibacter sp. TR-2022 TaxID=2585029 RepID=UPI001117F335|nr:alpha,alpha-phosphotrehalase [Testudinibacter sp. TR-2022]TNH04924.1 alpha,alpha-phosphotrehalase [Pasteurellaceae bacterium Phil31]TNH07223.1 alpha,alpha-phosphotrehalase [Testudinibacter sp. TR-2022]TNH12381.1 alpha,alpha-phosphotrehalase [Testudinibacter sp. TR-2022]TNH14020.1 alpha,alpha-phosphotrehalase [Testudinibacter sp. TR-2022]TNH16900.1 alpha,alpha-phosphotrehalase [Testudinibacter sp. TR-2022]